MARVHFTQNLERHTPCPIQEVEGATVAEALKAACAHNPKLEGYILDDQGQLRHHINIFVDGEQIDDRVQLSDTVKPDSNIYVMQALSGG